MLTDFFFLLVHVVALLYTLGLTVAPETAPPTAHWNLSHQPLIKEIPHRLAYRLLRLGHFLFSDMFKWKSR